MGDWYELGLTVEIAFGYGPTDTPVWTDVTDYVRAIPTIRRGRQSEYTQYPPGTATVVLDNRGRRFDPEHSSGPYFGDLLPMVPLRITSTTRDPLTDENGLVVYSEDNEWVYDDGVSFPIFYGFVQGWPQSIKKGYTDSTVTVVAVDAFRILNQRRLAASAYHQEVLLSSPDHYWPLQEQGTTFAAVYVDAVDGSTMSPVFGSSGLLDYFEPAPVSFGAPISADSFVSSAPDSVSLSGVSGVELRMTSDLTTAPRCLSFWFLLTADESVLAEAAIDGDNFLQVAVDGVTGISLIYSNATDNRRRSSVNTNAVPLLGVPGHVAVSADSTNIVVYLNGVQVYSSALTTGVLGFPARPPSRVQVYTDTLPLVGGVSHFAIWSGTAPDWEAQYHAGASAFGGDYVERTGQRVARVLDGCAWPAGSRDLSTGQSELGPYLPNSGSPLSYLRGIEQVEQGNIFVARNGDIVLRDRQWNMQAASSVTFADDYGTGLPFRDIRPDANTVDAIVNTVTITWADGTVTSVDQTSVDSYESSSLSVSSSTIKSLFSAQDLARWLIRLGKDPRTRITRLTLLPRNQWETAFPAILGLELGDVITVDVTPLGVGTATTYVLAVQGVEHKVTRQEWVTDLYLAPAVASSGPYWTIGDATLGKVGAAFGNKVPY